MFTSRGSVVVLKIPHNVRYSNVHAWCVVAASAQCISMDTMMWPWRLENINNLWDRVNPVRNSPHHPPRWLLGVLRIYSMFNKISAHNARVCAKGHQTCRC